MDNFKIYEIATWETNNCYAHMTLHVKKLKQSDNEIWLVNRI